MTILPQLPHGFATVQSGVANGFGAIPAFAWNCRKTGLDAVLKMSYSRPLKSTTMPALERRINRDYAIHVDGSALGKPATTGVPADREAIHRMQGCVAVRFDYT